MRDMAGSLRVGGAAPANEATGPIDLVHLDRATFGDRALRRDVLVMFEGQAIRLTEEIATAIDRRLRAEAAHTLRGAALGIGANAVAAAAAAIESANGEPEELTIAIARLTARVAEVRLAISGSLTKD
jgi:HPt (histidine-containing phosphotransfer) domain-containing protein